MPNLDLTGNGTPFKQFAEDKAPKTHVKRYLVGASWMKEYGGNDTVNTDKIYTMYKTAGWPLLGGSTAGGAARNAGRMGVRA